MSPIIKTSLVPIWDGKLYYSNKGVASLPPYSIMWHRKGETSLQVCLGCVSFKYSPLLQARKSNKTLHRRKTWNKWQQPKGEQRNHHWWESHQGCSWGLSSWRQRKSHHGGCARVEKMWHPQGVFLQKATWGCRKWALNCGTSFPNSLKDMAPSEEGIGCIGHLQDLHHAGEAAGQLPGVWDTETEQLTDQNPSHGASPAKVPKTGIRLQVHCKGMILSWPTHFWQKYFPTSPSPLTIHHGKLCQGKRCWRAQPS